MLSTATLTVDRRGIGGVRRTVSVDRLAGLAVERADLGERLAVDRQDLVAGQHAGACRRSAVVDVGDEALAVDLGAGDADAGVGDLALRREQRRMSRRSAKRKTSVSS